MKNSLVLYHDYLEKFKSLTDEQFGKLIRCMLTYDASGEIPSIDDVLVEVTFNVAKMDLDKNREKYESIVKRNQENGKKGGRPKNEEKTSTFSLVSQTGKVVPDGKVEGYHFLYLIKDITTGEYKIGETQNLKQRRLDIKRPTNHLSIVDFVIGDIYDCQEVERNIKKAFKAYSAGGDWFVANDDIAYLIMNEWFPKIPSGISGMPKYPEESKKAVNVNVNVNDNVNVIKDIKTNINNKTNIENKKVIDIKKEKVKKEKVYYPNDELLDAAFKNYVAMRVKIKKPLTDRAIELAIKKLDELSNGDNELAINILNQSIFNSWQGLYEVKEKKSKSIVDDWRDV